MQTTQRQKRERRITRRISGQELKRTHRAEVGQCSVRLRIEFDDLDHASVVMFALKRFVDDVRRQGLGTDHPVLATRYISGCERTANDIGAGLEAIADDELRRGGK